MEAMLSRLARKGVDVSSEAAELGILKKRLGEMKSLNGGPDQEEELYLQARLAKRHLFFRDPDLSPLQRILFVARHPYEPSHNYSDILDANWRPGGGIRVLNIPLQHGRLEPAAGTVTKLFEAGSGVARDPMAGFDGEQIYFAFRPKPNGYFHVYKMNTNGGGLKQLTDGPFHDYYPCPLPDTGLAFISTRCKARFLCWRPQAFVLFRMDADGENIWPLSYANLSEWGPSVMNDGRIIWTRSEYLDKGADFGHTLWAIHPDGTHPELIFGNNTLNCYMSAREVPGTTELCCTLISHGGDLNGPIALIDFSKAVRTRRRLPTSPRMCRPATTWIGRNANASGIRCQSRATTFWSATPHKSTSAFMSSTAMATASCFTWIPRSAACPPPCCARSLLPRFSPTCARRPTTPRPGTSCFQTSTKGSNQP